MTVAVLCAEALAVAALYLAAARRAGRWPAHRSAAFLAGLCAFVAVLAMPDERLPAHMTQHLALALVVAPLLVAGSPVALALRAAHRPARRVLRAPAAVHPLAGLAAMSFVMVVAHVPAVWERTDAGIAHVGAHAVWLAAGVLFWRPLVGADPVPHRPRAIGRLLLVLLAMVPMAGVGAAMASAQAPWYAGATLADTQAAGAIMWIGGGTLMALAGVAVGWAAVLAEHRRRLRVEEALG
jgi:cytochrome c oxidase assembly factor CtaG